MANPQPSSAPSDKYYLYDDASKIVYFSDEMPEEMTDLVFIGSSNNPNPKSAAAAFMQRGKVTQGFRLKPLTDR